jgi:hypothetical protein
VVPPTTLRDPESIQKGLEATLADTWLQENSHNRTRALVAILTAAMQALDYGDLRERMDAIEAELAQLRPAPRRVA